MSRSAVYVCTVFCPAECRHGVPCVIFDDDKHPKVRGHPRHFGDDGRMHEWSGEKGRCTVSDYPEDEGPGDGGEPMVVTVKGWSADG